MTHDDIQTALWDCLLEEYMVGKDEAMIQRLHWQMLEQRLNMRLYYLSEVSAKQLWEGLRKDESVLHFIMSLTIAFRFRLGLNHGENAFNDLCGVLDRSINNLADPKVADEVFCEQLPTGARLSKTAAMLMNNPWLVTLILIERNVASLTQRGFFPMPHIAGE